MDEAHDEAGGAEHEGRLFFFSGIPFHTATSPFLAHQSYEAKPKRRMTEQPGRRRRGWGGAVHQSGS